MKREKKKRKTNWKRRKENTKPSSTWQNTLTVCKSIRIEDQEHNEMVQRISSWVPITIKSLVLIENVPSWFNRIIIARTFKVLVGEES